MQVWNGRLRMSAAYALAGHHPRQDPATHQLLVHHPPVLMSSIRALFEFVKFDRDRICCVYSGQTHTGYICLLLMQKKNLLISLTSKISRY